MACLLGIDLGTSSVKALLMEPEGKVLAVAQQEYDILSSHAGYAEQDMELLWEATKSTIRRVLEASKMPADEVRGIGLSGQMHGLVLLDDRGGLLRNAIIWADQRSKEQIEEIYKVIPQDEYRAATLNSLCTGFYICSLLWVRKHEPELFQRIDRFCRRITYVTGCAGGSRPTSRMHPVR